MIEAFSYVNILLIDYSYYKQNSVFTLYNRSLKDMQSVQNKIYHAYNIVDNLQSVSVCPSPGTPFIAADIQVRNSDDQIILIQSSIITYNYGRQHQQHIFPINKEQDFDLHRAITHIENLAKNALIANNLIDTNLLQSTYDNENIAWLKTAEDFVAYSWTGDKEIMLHELGQGEYQFIIRARNIFEDQEQYKYLFEIIQLRFKEAKTFLFTEDMVKSISLISLDQFGNIFSNIGSALSGIGANSS